MRVCQTYRMVMHYALVNLRWLDGSPTIATTNLQPKELTGSVGSRMFSRLALSGAVTIELTGDDRRRNY